MQFQLKTEKSLYVNAAVVPHGNFRSAAPSKSLCSVPWLSRVTYSCRPSKKRDCKHLRRCNLCCQICATFLTVVPNLLAAVHSLTWLMPVTVFLLFLSVSFEGKIYVQCSLQTLLEWGCFCCFKRTNCGAQH